MARGGRASALAVFRYDVGGWLEGEAVPKDIDYTVAGLLHKVVKFECPDCHIPLSAMLNDAGKSDHCPGCGCEFTSPGQEMLKKDASGGAS